MNKTLTLAELSNLTKAQLIGNPDQLIRNVDSIENAGPEDATFLANPKYSMHLQTSSAGLICISENTTPLEGKNFLVSSDPSKTFQQIAELLCGPFTETGFTGIHPSAVIHPSAKIGPNVTIGPNAVIDQDAQIGPNTQIGACVFLGIGVQVGSDCLLYPHSVVRERCILGNRVILQPGAIIGSCGFGYSTDQEGKHTKLKQIGNVILEDDVEIGANTTIDRARFKTTLIHRGTKIDNLVQIGHNVQLGAHNIIVSQTGIAGSTTTGRNVVMGGQTGVVGHVDIADFVMIASRGGISKSIKKAGKYAGEPVLSLADHNRMQVHLRKIDEYARRIKELEERLEALQKAPVI